MLRADAPDLLTGKGSGIVVDDTVVRHEFRAQRPLDERCRRLEPEFAPVRVEDGESQHDHHGCEIIYLSARGKQRVLKDAASSNVRRLDKLLDVYVVVGRSGIATVGHRYKRITRP